MAVQEVREKRVPHQPPVCHPDRPLYANRQCNNCYQRDLRKRHDQHMPRQNLKHLIAEASYGKTIGTVVCQCGAVVTGSHKADSFRDGHFGVSSPLERRWLDHRYDVGELERNGHYKEMP
jgi:hypothetical protein